MGAWGLSPFDNDTFGEMFGDFVDRSGVASLVESKLTALLNKSQRGDADERWAAIGMVIWAYNANVLTDQYNKVIDGAITLYNELGEDEEWLGRWGDRRAFNRVFKKVGEALDDLRGRYDAPVLIPALSEAFESEAAWKRRKK